MFSVKYGDWLYSALLAFALMFFILFFTGCGVPHDARDRLLAIDRISSYACAYQAEVDVQCARAARARVEKTNAARKLLPEYLRDEVSPTSLSAEMMSCTHQRQCENNISSDLFSLEFSE